MKDVQDIYAEYYKTVMRKTKKDLSKHREYFYHLEDIGVQHNANQNPIRVYGRMHMCTRTCV